jgi:hypothetical protein
MSQDEDESADTDEADDPVASMYDQEKPGDTNDDEESDGTPAGFGGSPVGEQSDEPETSAGTFYVKHTEDSAVTLHEIDTSQIYTLVENPGLEPHQIIEATLMAQPPMQVSYLIKEMESQRTIPVETSPEPPTTRVMKLGTEMDEGQAAAIDREGEGEIHILRVEPEHTEHTAEEVHEDEMTYKNAARYGIERVEIRTDEDEGIVSIRYLP